MAPTIPEQIRAAVPKLDLESDADWTGQGLPSVDRVRELTGDVSIARADIEAAMPGITRATLIEAKDDSADDASAKTPGENPAPEIDQTSAASQETGETKATAEVGISGPEAAMQSDVFMQRGLLMAMLMQLPTSMRMMADKAMLDDMMRFVSEFNTMEERTVAVEMMRSIAEKQMHEIPSGQYKLRVRAAMEVVHGTIEDVQGGIAPADSNHAAAARLASITGGGSVGAPKPNMPMPSALDAASASDDQLDAAARLQMATQQGGSSS